MKVRLFRYCCDEIVVALLWGIMELDGVYEEVNMGYHSLDDRWQAGNVLTGEKYDPQTMSMSLRAAYCPFCGTQLIEDKT